MTITLNRPATVSHQTDRSPVTRPSTIGRTERVAHQGRRTSTGPSFAGTATGAATATAAEAAPKADADAVTLTLTVSLPAGTSDLEAAQLADALRAQAQRLTQGRRSRASVDVSSPRSFSPASPSLRALPPLRKDVGSARPEQPRRSGVVSPNSPARRDAEAARRRLLQATAVSPASPALAPDTALVIDLFGRRVRIDGTDVDLTSKAFELLAHLARNARRIVSREELMETVWSDSGSETGERTVDVHIRRVRAKLARYRRLISTVRGSGYRLDTGSDVAILN
jgi:hypothetical protein